MASVNFPLFYDIRSAKQAARAVTNSLSVHKTGAEVGGECLLNMSFIVLRPGEIINTSGANTMTSPCLVLLSMVLVAKCLEISDDDEDVGKSGILGTRHLNETINRAGVRQPETPHVEFSPDQQHAKLLQDVIKYGLSQSQHLIEVGHFHF